MQDVVGLRLVIAGGRRAQDEVVSLLFDHFASPKRKVEDRRAEPQHGYRAVHVIGLVDRRWVKIQVRTQLQHQWAELFEKVSDRWGRQIRYGEPPFEPDAVFDGAMTRAALIASLKLLSEDIDLGERLEESKMGTSFGISEILAAYAEQIL